MFETSPTTEKLDDALAKAQGEISAAGKSGMNPHFRKSYADLSDIWEACHEALSKHGVSVTQWPIVNEDIARLNLVTRLAHKGEWIKATISLPVMKNDAQAYGAAITYARRFALAAAVGVVSDEDDKAASKQSVLQENVEKQDERIADLKEKIKKTAPKPPPKNFAPGADNPPMPTEEPFGGTGGEDPQLAQYKIPFGKYVGKTISEVGALDAGKYLEYMLKSAKDKNERPTENILRFQDMYQRFMKQVAQI